MFTLPIGATKSWPCRLQSLKLQRPILIYRGVSTPDAPGTLRGCHGHITSIESQATELDIDFDAPAGNIALEVVGLGAVGGVQMELHSTRDSFMLLSNFLSQPGPPRPKPVPGATLEPVLEYAYTVPTTVSLPTLEPGEYFLRFYQPDDEDGAIEESVRVVAGQTTELNVDLSTMAEEPVGEETEDEPGEEATDELADTLEGA